MIRAISGLSAAVSLSTDWDTLIPPVPRAGIASTPINSFHALWTALNPPSQPPKPVSTPVNPSNGFHALWGALNPQPLPPKHSVFEQAKAALTGNRGIVFDGASGSDAFKTPGSDRGIIIVGGKVGIR